MVRRSRLAERSGVRQIELHSRRYVEGATKDDCFPRRQDGHLIQQPASLHRYDASEVIYIVRILKPMAYEVRALTDDCLTNLARPLAGDYKGKSEFTPLLGDPLIS